VPKQVYCVLIAPVILETTCE